MNPCCPTESTPEFPRLATCPVNGRAYRQVGRRTVLHHVQKPWQAQLRDQDYYFCTDPDCDVVYFGADQSVIRRDAVRLSVGQKSTASDRTVCYCFDMTHADILGAQTDSGNACKTFVVELTRQSVCDCEIRNPSGRCCLKDFP